MSKSKRPDYFKTKNFVASLRDMLSVLPTESEKQETEASFIALIEFLTRLQRNLSALPSAEDMSGVSQAIQKLEELFVKAETNPTLAGIVGLRRLSGVRRSKPMITEEERAEAKAVLADLEALPIDEIRSKLQSETFSVSKLRAIASVMSIKSTKGISRDALTHQITMKIANYRGYQLLRGEREKE
jgi:hypothetical protein